MPVGNLIQCMMSHKNFSYIQMVPIFQSAPFASCPYDRCHWKDSFLYSLPPHSKSHRVSVHIKVLPEHSLLQAEDSLLSASSSAVC